MVQWGDLPTCLKSKGHIPRKHNSGGGGASTTRHRLCNGTTFVKARNLSVIVKDVYAPEPEGPTVPIVHWSLRRFSQITYVTNTLKKFEEWFTEDLLNLVNYGTIPVINELSDYNHPCQIMADASTIIDHKGYVEGTKVGAFSIEEDILAVSYADPLRMRMPKRGFEPDSATVEMARATGLSQIDIVNDPQEAVKGADLIYADVWASIGRKKKAALRLQRFQGFQIDEELMSLAGPQALFMHCFPAERGVEVTDGMIEAANSIALQQAENRMHAQNAIMLHILGE